MRLATLCFLIILFSCNQNPLKYRLIEATKSQDVNESRLAETDYYINIPETMQIEIARGKEGQIGYSFVPKDSSMTLFGFIEIDFGQRLGDRDSDWGTLIEKVQSNLLNRQAIWKIYQTETGRYVAESSIKKIYAKVSSDTKSGVDSGISIISTLNRK